MNLHNVALRVLIAALTTSSSSAFRARDVVSATIGLGDTSDRKYVVSVTIGDSNVALQLDTGSSDLLVISKACQTAACQNIPEATSLDTGSSDLLVISKACQTAACQNISEAIYDPGSSFKELIPDTDISDIFLGQPIGHGRIGQDTVTIAGLTAKDQYIGVLDKIDNTTVFNGAVGIFGLGFPLASDVELGAAINKVFADPSYDPSLRDIFTVFGPMIPRLALTGAIEQPMFAVTLQRDTIDITGTGQLTIGQLPDGIDNSSITWIPVHLYNNVTNSTTAFPIHWEVPLDAIHIDDKQLPASHDLLNGSSILPLNALINMGNPYINGSEDVVNALLQTVSPSSSVANPPTFPCDTPHNLTFQIGGKHFPVDPRDFVSQPTKPGNATACAATVGSTSRAPTDSALYSWILGAPFLKSNLVVFYYGNLTDPAADPPRIGFLSLVPGNAGQLLKDAVQKAQSAGGNFETTTQAAPTSGGVSTDAPRSSKGNSAGSVHKLCSRLIMPVIALVFGTLYAL
ncbi:aspartic peptidase domain-containing protein [Fomes fomentarius]|nr:aspartic peptidase domain-containing protein [Fomes fomentarius]